jgi:LPS-assembly protein
MNGGRKRSNHLAKAALAGALAAGLCGGGPAAAQLAELASGGPPGSNNAPVNFTADQVNYDKTGDIVTARGHVRAVQNGQTLYADKVVLNRRTNIANAFGHVVLIEPSGQTVYADEATLSQGMKNAVMQGVAARLALNGRLIANGARRYDDKIDELAKVVYSACNLCKTDPTHPPLWQIRSLTATRDLQHKMIEYRDAEMEMDGIPVFYTPYLTMPDPSVKRATGLLIPSLGTSSRLGFFVNIPYFIVINQESDITLIPIIAAKQGPALDAVYRRDFNDGTITIDVSGGRDTAAARTARSSAFGDAIFSSGTFDLNQSWRAGFAYNNASNPKYLDDFNILPNATYLTSDAYVEGFGSGSYARLDAETFQGLVTSVNQSELPIVSPDAQYDFESAPDGIGGHYDIAAQAFNVLRKLGTNTRRLSAIPQYTLPFAGPMGQLWEARLELVAVAYNATRLYDQPNYSRLDGADTGRAEPYGALFMRWPFIRPAGRFGSQIVEPEVQLVAAPELGSRQNYRIPNEDSLDLEFTDANLFDFNRYPGIDRLEGGSRVDYALHGAWYLPDGFIVDGLFGQSYRFHKDTDYLPESGLNGNVSDYVGHIILTPTPWLNLTYRTRLSHDDLGARFIDTTASFGTHLLNFSTGYLYSNTDPYTLYDNPTPTAAYYIARHDVTFNATTNVGAYNFSFGLERNLTTGTFDQVNANAGWQNECFGVSLLYVQRFTSFDLDNGSTTVLVQFNFKTLGNVGFSAL